MPEIYEHENYSIALPDVKKVRDFLEGEPAVKRHGTTYLPHPNTAQKSDPGQSQRYQDYLMGGEVEDFPARTLESMLGRLNRNKPKVEIPAQIQYLIDDSDGDGMSLNEAVELSASNALAVNYHIVLCEYTRLPENLKDISREQKENLKLRASFKHYLREQLRDWSFEKVNDRMQLVYAKLVTSDNCHFEDTRYLQTTVLELMLDSEGYRQKITVYHDEDVDRSEEIRPTVNGRPLPFIPMEIITADRHRPGCLPIKTGYIAPLVYKAHHRYQVSADLKEKLRIMQDTSYSSGWSEAKKEEFETINGRDYFAMGAGVHNFMPDGVEIDILKMQADGDAHFKYLEENTRQVQAIGGNYGATDREKTATEVRQESAEELAELNLLANNLDECFSRLIRYAMIFEGVNADFEFSVNREFVDTKLTTEEIKAIRELYLDGLISKLAAIQKLIDGGFLKGDAEEILEQAEQDMPVPLLNN